MQAAKPAQLGLGGAGLIALLLVPTWAGPRLSVYTSGLAFVALFLSLVLLVRVAGQISLCHASFFALGATTFSHLSHDAGLPWILALVGAGVVTIPLGAILALPAIRLSGVYLALITFGFGLLMQNVVFRSSLMWGKDATLSGARPDFGIVDGSTDKGLYYVLLMVLIPMAALVLVITRSRLGRLLRALADSPVSLATNGLGVNVTKVLVFCISAFMAGIAGAMYLSQTTEVGPEGFGAFQSLSWLALVVAFAGTGLVASAFLAAAALAVAPAYLTHLTPEWQMALFGLGAVVAVLVSETDLRGWMQRRAENTTSRSALRMRPAGAEQFSESRSLVLAES